MEFPRNLRYSPLNFLIVDWGFNGVAFNNCGLPDPAPCPEPREPAPEPCCPMPIAEAIDTYDWGRWLPEVIVGVDDPDEEIAANYVREAAIQFSKYARVLQRQMLIPLQPGVCTYQLTPYIGEMIVGVIGISVDDCAPCEVRGCSGILPNGVAFTLDLARNELHLEAGNGTDCCGGARVLNILIWASPTEDACEHDVFLYDMFRREITLAARRNYVTALHFRDRALMMSVPSEQQFEHAKALAKNKAISAHSWSKTPSGSGMWEPARRNRGCW